MAVYELSPDVEDDLFEIWSFIAQDDPVAANRVEDELRLTFERLAKFPGQGALATRSFGQAAVLAGIGLPDCLPAGASSNSHSGCAAWQP